MEEQKTLNTGALVMAVAAYILWGILPIYWKLLGAVSAYEVLAHRIFWSFFFMLGLVLATGRTKGLLDEVRMVASNRKKLIHLFIGSVLISFNWLTYIWAVNHDRVVESSLGYYICPLLQVLTGVVIFRERLSLWQFLAVVLAVIGVTYLTVNYGSFPTVAVILALTFTVYGYCKKVTGLTAINGMTMETAITAPLAGIFLIYFHSQGQGYPLSLSPTFLLLMGTGVITAVPLIMFAHCINRLPLTVIGIIQYVSPTLTLLLGVFAYKEAFSSVHLIAFIFIWSGCALFTAARTTPMAKLERLISRGFKRQF